MRETTRLNSIPWTLKSSVDGTYASDGFQRAVDDFVCRGPQDDDLVRNILLENADRGHGVTARVIFQAQIRVIRPARFEKGIAALNGVVALGVDRPHFARSEVVIVGPPNGPAPGGADFQVFGQIVVGLE
jgi:hypothetical protein